MLEVTQEILERVDPMLDAEDVETAATLLLEIDQTSLRAVLIHILQERGSEVADAVGIAYLSQRQAA